MISPLRYGETEGFSSPEVEESSKPDGAAEAANKEGGAKKLKCRHVPLPLSSEDADRVLAQALRFAAKDIPTFALMGNRKPVSEIGWHSASVDPKVLTKRFKNGVALLALRPFDAGWCIIDVPAKDVGCTLLREMTPTYTVMTPSGGLHLYYRVGGKGLGNTFLRNFRVISDRGYALTPGNPGYTVQNAVEPAELPAWMLEEITATWRRVNIYRPSQGLTMPKPSFWDKDETFPRKVDGAVATLSAKKGAHKTNLILTKLFDAILEKGARVAYCAGEGFIEVITQRLPAHCALRGIKVEDLDGKLAVIDGVPLLTDPVSVASFIDQVADEMPEIDIIVIDTLATATAGAYENTSEFSGLLTDNGPAGQIKRFFKCLVIFPAHWGHQAERARGHSGIGGNVDAELDLKCWPKSGGLELTASKIKGGRDGFSVHYQVPPKGSTAVPVPVRIDEKAFELLTLLERSDSEEDAEAKAPRKTQAQRAAEAGQSLSTWKRHQGAAKPVSQNELVH